MSERNLINQAKEERKMKKGRGRRTLRGTGLTVCVLVGLLFALAGAVQADDAIPISSCTTISMPGEFELIANLTASPGTTCITITASDVELELNGHTISGPGGGVDDFKAGIQVVGVMDVEIEGPGVVTGFARGIDFNGVDDSEVKGVTAMGNFFGFVVNRDFFTPDLTNLSENNEFEDNVSTGNNVHGFTLNGASNNQFEDNIASNNSDVGILLFDGTGNEVEENTTNGNGMDGIKVGGGATSGGHVIEENTANGNDVHGIHILAGSTDNTIEENTALNNNSVDDLVDDNPNCDDNTWEDNQFGTANQTCIQ